MDEHGPRILLPLLELIQKGEIRNLLPGIHKASAILDHELGPIRALDRRFRKEEFQNANKLCPYPLSRGGCHGRSKA